MMEDEKTAMAAGSASPTSTSSSSGGDSLVPPSPKGPPRPLLKSASATSASPSSKRQASIDLDEDLWDSGQEWILIFDNLLKHPRGRGRGCKCDMCLLDKNIEASSSAEADDSRHHLARSRSGFHEETLFSSLGRNEERTNVQK